MHSAQQILLPIIFAISVSHLIKIYLLFRNDDVLKARDRFDKKIGLLKMIA